MVLARGLLVRLLVAVLVGLVVLLLWVLMVVVLLVVLCLVTRLVPLMSLWTFEMTVVMLGPGLVLFEQVYRKT